VHYPPNEANSFFRPRPSRGSSFRYACGYEVQSETYAMVSSLQLRGHYKANPRKRCAWGSGRKVWLIGVSELTGANVYQERRRAGARDRNARRLLSGALYVSPSYPREPHCSRAWGCNTAAPDLYRFRLNLVHWTNDERRREHIHPSSFVLRQNMSNTGGHEGRIGCGTGPRFTN